MNTSRICNYIALLLTLPLAATHHLAVAQDTNPEVLPECDTVSYDPDGDGFGWDIYAQSSCRVTDNTTPAPQVTHRETGQPALLERGFWDGNADLVNRNLHCRQFEWSEDDSQYQLTTENWFRFRALPEQPPWISEYFSRPELIDPSTISGLAPLQWSVDFGLFTSRSREEIYRAEFPASRDWIERFTSDDGHTGVRFWLGSFNAPVDAEFSECVDISGAPFGPTGRWDQPATTLPSIYSDTPLYFTGTEEPYPNITNRETGQAVQFESGTWEFQADLSHRTVECTNIVWNDVSGVYHQTQYNSGFNDLVTFHPLLANSPINESRAWVLFDHRRYVRKWKVDGENFSSPSRLANSMWYEPIEREFSSEVGRTKGVRYWGSPATDAPEERNRGYSDCYAAERPPRGIYSVSGPVIDFQPKQEAPLPEVESPTTDDNSSDQNNPDSEQADSSDNNPTTDSGITSDPQNETEPMSGGGSFSLLALWLAVFRNRLFRKATLTRTEV